jgi:hypothetical protein
MCIRPSFDTNKRYEFTARCAGVHELKKRTVILILLNGLPCTNAVCNVASVAACMPIPFEAH